jgi:hypothetical protein
MGSRHGVAAQCDRTFAEDRDAEPHETGTRAHNSEERPQEHGDAEEERHAERLIVQTTLEVVAHHA